jgi:hypothetical protein
MQVLSCNYYQDIITISGGLDKSVCVSSFDAWGWAVPKPWTGHWWCARAPAMLHIDPPAPICISLVAVLLVALSLSLLAAAALAAAVAACGDRHGAGRHLLLHGPHDPASMAHPLPTYQHTLVPCFSSRTCSQKARPGCQSTLPGRMCVLRPQATSRPRDARQASPPRVRALSRGRLASGHAGWAKSRRAGTGSENHRSDI